MSRTSKSRSEMHKRKQMPKQKDQCENLSKKINIVKGQLNEAKAYCGKVTKGEEKKLCNEFIKSSETILKNFSNEAKHYKCPEKKS